MSLKVGDIFNGARAVLNDNSGAIFTNDDLLPYFKMAYEEIRQECESNNIPITNKTSEPILINANVRDIGGPTGPALPSDLIEPLSLWERSSQTNQDYMYMRPTIFLPKTDQRTAFLEVYAWMDQYIHFLGATGAIQVKIDYISAGIPDIVNANTLVKLTNAVNFLKYKTAALASMFVGENETRAQVAQQLATDAYDTLINIKVKSGQKMVKRRRPFRAGFKNRTMNP